MTKESEKIFADFVYREHLKDRKMKSTIIKFKKPEDAKLLLLQGKTYVKKPLPVRAIQLHYFFTVKTLEGTMKGKLGDYLIEGIEGELYVCDKEIFEKSYEKVEE